VTIACPDCGTIEELPPLPPRGSAVCVRCDGDLEKRSGRTLVAALACAVATFLLLFPINILPLISVHMFGLHGANVTAAGISMLFAHGWVLLAGLSAILVILLPFCRFGLLSAVLGALRLGYRPRWLPSAFRWAVWLDRWAMLDVYLLAGAVGYFRLLNEPRLHVSIEAGGMCFVAAALLTMISRAALDRRTVWRSIGREVALDPGAAGIACTTCDLLQPLARDGDRCLRCRARLHRRKPEAVPRTVALLLAALLLYFPANIYPMNVSHQLGARHTYTIFTGIRELFAHGLWELGVVIFCTSILIPVGKIIVIAWCVLSVWRHSRRRLVLKTKLFRSVAELGRWSKTDPFAIVFFVPLIDFGRLASENAGWGATAFILMTLLTMCAAATFDPRLMWDAAEAGAAKGLS
jgi:paraquat-inducible protein A